jgi:hypothetical protein
MPALDALRAQAVLAEYLVSLRYKDSTIRTKTAYLKPFFEPTAGTAWGSSKAIEYEEAEKARSFERWVERGKEKR